MSTLQERLWEMFPRPHKHGLKAQIARLCGVKAASVTNWFNSPERVSTISRENAEILIAHYRLGVAVPWLAEGKGKKLVDDPNTINEDTQKANEVGASEAVKNAVLSVANSPGAATGAAIPFLMSDGAVAGAALGGSVISTIGSLNDTEGVHIKHYATGGAMGHGLILRDQPGVIREIVVSDEWLQKNTRNITSAKNLVVVTGFGDSMRPIFQPGDPLLVDTGVTTVDFDGIYFFRVENEGFVKRLQRIPGEGLVAISENKAYREWTIKQNMDFQVFGRVVKAWSGQDY